MLGNTLNGSAKHKGQAANSAAHGAHLDQPSIDDKCRFVYSGWQGGTRIINPSISRHWTDLNERQQNRILGEITYSLIGNAKGVNDDSLATFIKNISPDLGQPLTALFNGDHPQAAAL